MWIMLIDQLCKVHMHPYALGQNARRHGKHMHNFITIGCDEFATVGILLRSCIDSTTSCHCSPVYC